MLIDLEERIWKKPLYADFPRFEYDNRITRMKKLMAVENLDVLVLWDPNNIRYFSGYNSLHWAPLSICVGVMIITVDKEPMLIVPDFFLGVVEGFTFIENIRLMENPHVTANIRELPKLVANTVKDIGYSKGRIGIEGGWFGGMAPARPINDIDVFRSNLEEAEFVYAADSIWKCRVIKSVAEIDAIRIATEVDVRVYGDLVANFEMGWTEKDVARFVRSKVLEYTDDCPPPLCLATSRKICMADIPAFDEGIPLLPGDRLALEPYPIYKGYWGSCARCFSIGEMTDEQHKIQDAMDQSRLDAAAAIKPGVTGGDIMDVINESLESNGAKCSLDQGGHGVGLNFQEPPAIALKDTGVIEEGMVMAVESWYLEGGDMNVNKILYGGEDYVVVTKDGADPMPVFPPEIRYLGV